jgi:hypothetical protein
VIPLHLRWLADATLRASPALRLYQRPPVPPRARDAVRKLRTLSGVAGILATRSRRSNSFTALNTDGVRLWRALAHPTSLGDALPAPLDEASNAIVAGMVLDGLLELLDAGHFVSGLDAFPLIFEGTPTETVSLRLGRIAVRALRHATGLSHLAPAVITGHLYRYHGIPCSAARHKSFRQADESDLGRRAGWIGLPSRPTAPWECWTPSRANWEAASSQPLYKLYVSPSPDQVRPALRTVLTATPLRSAVALKLGRGLPGLLRPDKMVVYFLTQAELLDAGRFLETALAGITPHGVPFSGTMTRDGLLSYGVDPASDVEALSDRESWRQRVTRLLGDSLATSHRSKAQPVPPWMFAVLRLTLEGVQLPDLSLHEQAPSPQRA